MHRAIPLALAAMLLSPALGAQQAPAATDWSWNERIASGNWIRIENLNGAIEVERSDGDRVEVRAEKDVRRGNAEEVRIVVVRDGGSATICALWHEDATCDAEGAHYPSTGRRGRRENNVNVNFTVRLPRGVKVAASTVNGEVDVRGASAEVEASTVNGRVEAATSSGPVRASTVNGGVRVRMETLAGSGDMKFSTVNGAVVVEAPASLDAEVELETVNGSIRSDYPMTVSGRMSPRHLRAVIGKGGRRITMSTVNGSIELRKL